MPRVAMECPKCGAPLSKQAKTRYRCRPCGTVHTAGELVSHWSRTHDEIFAQALLPLEVSE